MVDRMHLALVINDNLRVMDESFAKAKQCMGVKPRLDEAAAHAREVNLAIHALSDYALQAEAIFGIRLPPDVVHRVNARQVELLGLANEIAACTQVITIRGAKIGNSRQALN